MTVNLTTTLKKKKKKLQRGNILTSKIKRYHMTSKSTSKWIKKKKSVVLPVAQSATNVWACFLRICLVDWWIFSLDRKCSIKSWGVIAARSHFNLLRTSSSICCRRQPEALENTALMLTQQ